MKAPLGSTVYYMGKEWINGCEDCQPVFGISRDDAIRSTVYKFRLKKTFARYLREAIMRKQRLEEKEKQKMNSNINNTAPNKIDLYV